MLLLARESWARWQQYLRQAVPDHQNGAYGAYATSDTVKICYTLDRGEGQTDNSTWAPERQPWLFHAFLLQVARIQKN